jgi:putative DNA primase/helicase
MAVNQIKARGITDDDESVSNNHNNSKANQSPSNDAWSAKVIQPEVWPPKGVLFKRKLLTEAMAPIAHLPMFTIYEAKPKENADPFKFKKVPVNTQGTPLKDDWQRDNSHKLTLIEAMDGAEALVKSKCRGYGVGLVFTSAKGGYDGYSDVYLAAIDIDGCRNPESGEISPQVQAMLDQEDLTDTYWEISPSKRGMRGLCFVKNLDHLRDTKVIIDGVIVGFEIFIASKWVTLTGQGVRNKELVCYGSLKGFRDRVLAMVPEKTKAKEVNVGDVGFELPEYLKGGSDDVTNSAAGKTYGPIVVAENRKALSSAVDYLIEQGFMDNGYDSWRGVVKDLAGARSEDILDDEGQDAEFLYNEARRFSEASVDWNEEEFERKWNDPGIRDGRARGLFAKAQALGWKNPGPDSGGQSISRDQFETAIASSEISIQGEHININADDITLIQGTLTHDKVAMLSERTFKDQFLFNHSTGTWMVYAGGVWREDTLGRVPNSIRQLTRIANVLRKAGPENAHFILGVEKLARNAPVFATVASDFDADIYMLNTPAGAIDLKTGVMRPALPEDRFSKSTLVAPSREGGAAFRKFLNEITIGDVELQRFIQVSLGACLSGGQNGHWLLFWIGEGRNGKNTLGDLVADIFNDYATKIQSSVLMSKTFEAHPTEIAQLHGIRLATASEVEEGSFWNESRLNELTGDKTLNARRMRQDSYQFDKTHKHLVYGNHRPQIRNATPAIKSRLKLVPFKASFAGREDSTLPDRLRDEAAYVLHWLLEGHEEWMANGQKLPHCDAVESESREYFESQSTIEMWIEERTVPVSNLEDPANSWAKSNSLYSDFKDWKQRRGEGVVSLSRFGEMMKKKFPSVTSAGVRYGGIKLRPFTPSSIDQSVFDRFVDGDNE